MTRLLLTTLLLSLPMASPLLRAQVPRTISFQGVITDAQGTFVPDGAHTLTVRIYAQASGGAALFEESASVAVTRGVFNMTIGATSGGIPDSIGFDRQYFVGAGVDGGAELLPRTPMTAVPYAFRAVFADAAGRAETARHADSSGVSERAALADRATTADRATVATTADALATSATNVVRSVNGRSGSLTIAGQGLTVATSGDTLRLRALPVSYVHAASVSAIELIDSIRIAGGAPLVRLDLRDPVSTRLGLRITSRSHGVSAIEASTEGGGSVAHFSKSVDRATGAGGTFIGPVLVAESRAGSQVTAAQFNALDTGNTRPAVDIEHRGKGVALQVDGTGANIATFRRRRVNAGGSSTSAVVRFDSTGKGFFDGGTQTGGADIAEAFDVDGEQADYSPGDVLVIATGGTRRVTLAREPYSTLVAGVHATKPGVLLTERTNEEGIEAMVPMGVVGVLPTKVTVENGSIAIGDLIVTSSTPGHAMRGDPTVAATKPGCIIGKALETFDGPGEGVIMVLVK